MSKVVKGVNDLATVSPTLAKQLVLGDPTTIAIGSSKIYEWHCAGGHTFKASPASRKRGRGCPYCAGKKVLAGFNDLATEHPDIAKEAAFDPTTVRPKSHKVLKWKCLNGHEYVMSVASRTQAKDCPVCSGRRVIKAVNDLVTTHPELAAQALFDPTTVSYGSGVRLDWRCPKGHTFQMTPNARSHRGRGCPVCSGNRVEEGANDLASQRPELASEALFDPTTVTAGSSNRLPWRCPAGHEYEMTPAHRSSGGNCPYCSGKRVLPGFNDLATTNPRLAAEAQFDATTVTEMSNKRMRWKCSLGHTWQAVVYSRKKNGCPYCGGKAVLQGFNDLATTHPKLAAEALFDATSLTAGSNSKVRWTCPLGHEYEAVVTNRVLRNDGCPYCSGHKVLPGFNDLATKLPELVGEAEFDPTTVTPGANAKKLWKCPNGHRYSMSPNARSSGQGCPSCATFGFSPEEPAWLYLLQRLDDPRVRQVGITNNLEARLARHARNAFDLVDQRGPLKGYNARDIERLLLRFLREQSVSIARIEVDAKFDGYTETFWDDKNLMTTLYDLIQLAEEWESGIS
jgi:DNA-directed RNA polymerase subunit RPC12/RpoP